MKYYTSTIPLPLAEKLKAAGMSVDIDCETYDSGTEYQRDEVWCNNTYAEVFDWLMEKDVFIKPDIVDKDDGTLGYVAEVIFIWKQSIFLGVFSTWHEAAEAAIEKALDLI